MNKDKRSAVVGKKINVGGGNDPSYRYGIPILKVQLLPKGTYNETLITNLKDVIKSVQTFHKYTEFAMVKKFLGQALKVGVETNKAGIAKLRGEFTSDKLNRTLLKYFDLFVLCPKCCSPETKGITDDRGSNIFVLCKACGGGWPVLDEARRHKFYSTAVKKAKVKNSAAKELAASAAKRRGKRSGSGTPKRAKNSPRSARGSFKKMNPHQFLELKEDITPEVFAKFCMERGKEKGLLEGFAALFWDAETLKARMTVMKEKHEWISSLISLHGKGGYEHFVGVLTYLAAPKPKTLKALFSTAIGNDIVGLDHLEAWAKRPYAKVVDNIGVGLPPDADALKACVSETAEVLEYLRNLDESSSEESSSEED